MYCDVFVAPIPRDFTNRDLFDLFKEYHPTRALVAVHKGTLAGRGFGFVRFGSEAAARLALELDGLTVGGIVVHARLADEHKVVLPTRPKKAV